MNTINLEKLGLSEKYSQEASLYDGFLGRVSVQHKNLYQVLTESGEIYARVSGKFSYNTTTNTDYPVVGDWVILDRTHSEQGDAIIHHVLNRKSVFERKMAGTSNQSQIIASNVDILFLCMSLNNDFNLRRLERYLAVAYESGATPIVVLTKSDLCSNLEQAITEVNSVAIGTDILVTSSVNIENNQAVYDYIKEGVTVAFVGSSGVGKSTLINSIAGKNILATNAIREDDDKGRHTTTHRQLLLLENGGVVIDTPGMRELHLDIADFSKSFEDIEQLIIQCKFSDCSHTTEPSCAIRQAINSGNLSQKRFDNFEKLRREASYQGLNSRQLEQEKIKSMFGGMSEMKQAMKYVKQKGKKI